MEHLKLFVARINIPKVSSFFLFKLFRSNLRYA